MRSKREDGNVIRKYIQKRMDKRERTLYYDFLPAMNEIIEKPENSVAEWILFLVAALLVSTILWMAFCKIDISVTATGSLIPKGNLIEYKSRGSGDIAEIYVEEGSRVEEGDAILRLDSGEEETELTKLQYEQNLLQIQREEYIAALSEINAIGTEDIEKMNEILKNLNSLDVKISEEEMEIERLKELIEAKILKAPVKGIIINLSAKMPDTPLGQGQTVCYIIPKEKPLIFQAYIPTKDIKSVEKGQEVRVKLYAMNDTEYEVLEGSIGYISDMAVSMDGKGMYYLVEVDLEDAPQEELKVGLEGSMDIIVGERTILDYFMEPFLKGLKESLHEK